MFSVRTCLPAIALLFSGLACETENFGQDKPGTVPELLEYNKFKITISQGVSGTLLVREGSCNVGSLDSCRFWGGVRKVHFYEKTSVDQAERAGNSLFKDVQSRLVASVQSDADGFYEVALSPGQYSLFVEAGDLLYARSVGKDGGIEVTTVDSGWVTIIHPEFSEEEGSLRSVAPASF